MSNYWATREVMTFDVDKFIADVCKKYEQMAQENPALAAWAKTEEELRKLWDAVLNVRRPGGDASLYPNAHGPQPALMEVWHKAGDFWRAKYRLGDKLLCDQNGAALSPTELGWIAKAKAETEEQFYSNHTENEALLHDSNHATEGACCLPKTICKLFPMMQPLQRQRTPIQKPILLLTRVQPAARLANPFLQRMTRMTGDRSLAGPKPARM